jgi:hypothetical protein
MLGSDPFTFMPSHIKPVTPTEMIKWNKFFAEYDQKTASTMNAILDFAHHFADNEFLIEKDAENKVQENLPKWNPSNDDNDEISEYLMERDLARTLHDETLIPMHRYSCIVMLYIVVERELKRLMDNLQVVTKQTLKMKQSNESYLAKAKNLLNTSCNLDVSKCPTYSTLDDLRKVRNCIVHSNGELSLCNEKDQEFLCKLKHKYKHLFAHPKSDIDVSQESIKQFLINTTGFFIWVFEQLQQIQPVDKLNWKINATAEFERLDKILSKIQN